MKITKSITTLFGILLLLSSSSCQNKYPELGDGVFAEFATTKDTMVVQLFYKKDGMYDICSFLLGLTN